MKIVIGIVLIALVIMGLAAYLVLMLNAREMIFCGDVKNDSGTATAVTRVYTTDLSANETLSEIIVKMNESQDGAVQVQDLTEVLAQYQNIIYAPVFTITVQQVDTSTYVINGSVYNGVDDNGDAVNTDYRYCDMNVSTVVTDGIVLAAQNVYDDVQQDEQDPAFIERPRVIDPIVKGEASEAAFSMQDCSSFRAIVHGTDAKKLPHRHFRVCVQRGFRKSTGFHVHLQRLPCGHDEDSVRRQGESGAGIRTGQDHPGGGIITYREGRSPPFSLSKK